MPFNPCIYPGQLLLPKPGSDLSAWACVACDQFTSQPEYWQDVELQVGSKPSAYRIILPECYLAKSDELIPGIHQTMADYVANGTLVPAVEQGFILVERITPAGARLGLVGVLDLECYDNKPGSRPLVRASEGTIFERIPPRVKIRKGAPLESSHVMLLMDDPMQSVVEPLYAKRNQLEKLYDFTLMKDGGQLIGYAVTEGEDISAIYAALEKLSGGDDPMLFAVGDGNHSLATAKAIWDSVKTGLTPEETVTHPARFAMVEIENIYDDALQFEPIHRVLFGYDGDELLNDLAAFAAAKKESLVDNDETQNITIVYEGKEVTLAIPTEHQLAVGDLQNFLDQWLAAHPGVTLDYVHGEGAVRELAKNANTIGFLLPKPDKGLFFQQIRQLGALPRKTFSMGEANEKRYYMECRKITK
ncbi:MAG: DUF1015 domain-containing protein [Clostridiales bacterium]|nr:DUF1015 domain-containing protein [Clostridiales bacterium]